MNRNINRIINKIRLNDIIIVSPYDYWPYINCIIK